MRVKVGEYFILKRGASKPVLAKCTSVGDSPDDNFAAIVNKSGVISEDSTQLDFLPYEVLAVLGKRPHAGTLYGVKVEPVIEKFTSSFWGDVRVYQHLKSAQIEALKDKLNNAKKRIQKQKLSKILIDTEIRQPQGKYSGYYKYLPKSEVDVLCIKPNSNFENFEYIALHEYAHGIWSRLMSLDLRSLWIKLYHNYIILDYLNELDLTSILEEIKEAGSFSDYLKNADEDSSVSLRHCLKYVSSVHGLNKHHLETQIISGLDISEYWPEQLEFSDKSVAITEYSMKSPEEFFAEAYSHYTVNVRIPDKIIKLLEKTLQSI